MEPNLNGWIRLRRIELKLLRDLTEPEYRYFLTACLLAVWDGKKRLFGSFDSRTDTMKAYLGWSSGKVNKAKNSLLKKGYFVPLKDYRLGLKNAGHLFGRSQKVETDLQRCEGNFHTDEGLFQRIEKRRDEIDRLTHDLASRMAVSGRRDSAQ